MSKQSVDIQLFKINDPYSVNKGQNICVVTRWDGTDHLRYVKTKSWKDGNRFIINDVFYYTTGFNDSRICHFTLFYYVFYLLCIYASEDNDHL